MTTLRLAALAAAVVSTAACVPSPVSGPAAGPFDGTFWRPTALDGQALSSSPAAELAFGAGGAFSATGGCNRTGGQAQISAAARGAGQTQGRGTIRFPAQAAATLVACPPEAEARDRALASALSRARTYRRDGQQMDLLDAEGRVVARLQEV